MSKTTRPPAKVVIGLDVGTTAAKAVAFGQASSWRHVAVREYPLLEPTPGWQVQDPETVLAALLTALADAAEAVGGADVVGLTASTAMHGHRPRTRRCVPSPPWSPGPMRARARRLGAFGPVASPPNCRAPAALPCTPCHR